MTCTTNAETTSFYNTYTGAIYVESSTLYLQGGIDASYNVAGLYGGEEYQQILKGAAVFCLQPIHWKSSSLRVPYMIHFTHFYVFARPT